MTMWIFLAFYKNFLEELDLKITVQNTTLQDLSSSSTEKIKLEHWEPTKQTKWRAVFLGIQVVSSVWECSPSRFAP